MGNKIELHVRELSENVPLSVEQVRLTNDYNELTNKPQINGVELIGSLSLEDIGAQEIMTPATEEEINAIINGGGVNEG